MVTTSRRRIGSLYRGAVVSLVVLYAILMARVWHEQRIIPVQDASSSSSSSVLVTTDRSSNGPPDVVAFHLSGFQHDRRQHARPLPSKPKVNGLPQAVIETATTPSLPTHSQSVVQLVTRGASSNHTGTTTTTQNRRKLQEKLDAIFLATGKPYTGDLWELSDYVPQWMKGM